MADDTLTSNIKRFGPLHALLILVLRVLRRALEFEVCLVQINSGQPYDYPAVEEYVTRSVDDATFHGQRSPECPSEDYHWAFARGDVCTANLQDDQIVGYGFHSSLPTRVREGVEFFFPPWYIYSFADFTANSHRGRRLAQERWRAARAERNAEGKDPLAINYTNVTNVASRRADQNVVDSVPSILLGYTAWWRFRGRTYCWQSKGAARYRTGFRSTPGGSATPSGATPTQ